MPAAVCVLVLLRFCAYAASTAARRRRAPRRSGGGAAASVSRACACRTCRAPLLTTRRGRRPACCVVDATDRNRDADRRTSVMPAATNLGSYSDKSNFFSRPASVCGCLAPPPPPTLPPKIPHDAGPPSSPQEMSNMGARPLLTTPASDVAHRCSKVQGQSIAALRCVCHARTAPWGLFHGCPNLSVPERRRPARKGRSSPILAGSVQGLFWERWSATL